MNTPLTVTQAIEIQHQQHALARAREGGVMPQPELFLRVFDLFFKVGENVSRFFHAFRDGFTLSQDIQADTETDKFFIHLSKRNYYLMVGAIDAVTFLQVCRSNALAQIYKLIRQYIHAVAQDIFLFVTYDAHLAQATNCFSARSDSVRERPIVDLPCLPWRKHHLKFDRLQLFVVVFGHELFQCLREFRT